MAFISKPKNVNRLVWANGFTNDKRHISNQEPYKKVCKNCKKSIWMKPENTGWKAINPDGTSHVCAKKEKPKTFKKKCKFCKTVINMVRKKGKWVPLNENGKRHKCKRINKPLG